MRDFTRDEYYLIRVASLQTVALKSLHLIISNSLYMEKLLIPKSNIYKHKEEQTKNDTSERESEYIKMDEGL